MRALPLTLAEVANVVTRKVRGYEAIGLGREGAILMAASVYEADPAKLAELVPPRVAESAA